MANPIQWQRKSHWLSGALLQNPVLTQSLGLAAVIVAATTLREAVWVAAVSAAHLVLCEVLAAALLRKFPAWLRIALYAALGLLITCPVTWFLDNSNHIYTLSAMRLFLPLLSVNALAAARCERFAVENSVRDSLRDALSNSLGFAGVTLFVGAIRELMGYGSLWGKEFLTLKVRGFWMPFGGFLLLGAFAAALKMLLRFLAEHGWTGATEEVMERGPEDRQERLQKRHTLLTQELPKLTPEFLKAYQESQTAPAKPLHTETKTLPEPAPEPVPPPEPEPEPPRNLEPHILPEDTAPPQNEAPVRHLSPEEKLRLDQELEELLKEFRGGQLP